MQTNVQPEAPAPMTDGVVIRTEGLTKVYDTGVKAVDAPGPGGPRGRDLRPARAERRGEDDDGRHAHHARHPDRGARDGRRRRRRRASLRGEGTHGRRLADQHARSQPHRVGEPLLPRPLLRDGHEGIQARRHADARGLPARATAPTPTCPRSPAAWRSGSWSRAASSTVRERCSWTSRRPGSTRRSRIALWEIIGQIHAEGQTVVLTTHYMEEADRLCQRVAIMDHGKLLALDTPEG